MQSVMCCGAIEKGTNKTYIFHKVVHKILQYEKVVAILLS